MSTRIGLRSDSLSPATRCGLDAVWGIIFPIRRGLYPSRSGYRHMRAKPVIRRLPFALAILLQGVIAAADIVPPPAFARRVWRTQEGLPENRVHALAQTPDGYLWIGTSGGLARFDGARFVVFAHINTPAMTADDIRALAVGRDGSLWIATDGAGLLHYKEGRFRLIGPSEGLSNEFVGAVLEDSSGTVWVGT